ncbi:MAG: hypothetical protein ABW096_14500 [Candidatus Thiodiazotropha sp.]
MASMMCEHSQRINENKRWSLYLPAVGNSSNLAGKAKFNAKKQHAAD